MKNGIYSLDEIIQNIKDIDLLLNSSNKMEMFSTPDNSISKTVDTATLYKQRDYWYKLYESETGYNYENKNPILIIGK